MIKGLVVIGSSALVLLFAFIHLFGGMNERYRAEHCHWRFAVGNQRGILLAVIDDSITAIRQELVTILTYWRSAELAAKSLRTGLKGT